MPPAPPVTIATLLSNLFIASPLYRKSGFMPVTGRNGPGRLPLTRSASLSASRSASSRSAAHILRDSDRRSEEHTSELQSLMRISYAVFCLKKKKNTKIKAREQREQHITIEIQQNTKTKHEYINRS